jgi:hypothetical protein
MIDLCKWSGRHWMRWVFGIDDFGDQEYYYMECKFCDHNEEFIKHSLTENDIQEWRTRAGWYAKNPVPWSQSS